MSCDYDRKERLSMVFNINCFCCYDNGCELDEINDSEQPKLNPVKKHKQTKTISSKEKPEFILQVKFKIFSFRSFFSLALLEATSWF